MYSERVPVANELATAKFSCTRAPSVLGTHFSAIASHPTSTAPLDDSDGIHDKFDYGELRNGA
jgi:hypothetical protein